MAKTGLARYMLQMFKYKRDRFCMQSVLCAHFIFAKWEIGSTAAYPITYLEHDWQFFELFAIAENEANTDTDNQFNKTI